MAEGSSDQVHTRGCDESLVPKIDMVFENDEKAYHFYCAYAKEMGFGVRKHLVKRRSSGVVYARVFSCYKEGFCRTSRDAKRRRPDSRTGCQAQLTVRIMDDGRFRVSEFEANHNHELVPKAEPAEAESREDWEPAPRVGQLRGRPAKLRAAAQAVRVPQRPAVSSPLESGECCSGSNVASGSWIPKVDMEFLDDESAYQFYTNYALQIGFSVRKHLVRRRTSGVVYSRMYACHKEGYNRRKDQQQQKAPKPYERNGCQASLTIKITKNGRYRVTEFHEKHNHPLVIPSKAHLFKWRWQKGLIGSEEEIMDSTNGQEFTPKHSDQTVNEQDERDPQPSSNSVGSKCCITSKCKSVMKVGDAGAVLQYVQEKQIEDPSFYYALHLDGNDQLTNVFWTDAKSMTDFNYFGDVVCFDTTYKSRNYGRPFVQFIGVNHHKQAIIYGAALVYDEAEESFKWLFETFSTVMGRQPNVILTDKSEAMSNAISVVWPGTPHRQCVWHMYINTANHLYFVFQASNAFAKDFSHCVYDIEEESEFESEWESLLEKYDLRSNEWLAILYKDREKWALPYGREVFCADLKDTLSREHMDDMLKSYLYPELNLLDFFKHYEKIVQARRHAELQADFHAHRNRLKLPTSKMLRQAASAYTPAVFKVFQKEFELSLDCMVYSSGQVDTALEYKVTTEDNPEEYLVRFHPSNCLVNCSCKKFEFNGIHCRHVLKTLDIINIKELPSQYILKRWTKDAKRWSPRGNSVFINSERKPTVAKRSSTLCNVFNKIAARAAETVESYMFIENLSDQLMDQVNQILQTRPPEKPSAS